MARGQRFAAERLTTRALLLRRTMLGDADVVALLFTEERGVVSVVARSARRASSKLGVLEPIHTLTVTLEIRPGRDIAKLVEARIATPRLHLLEMSAALDAGFRALVWVRGVLAPLEPERIVFASLTSLLDALDGREGTPEACLARAGLEILTSLGYRLELEACVRCGKPCPDRATAFVDARAGGLVCSDCARDDREAPRNGFRLAPTLRTALIALQNGKEVALDTESEQTALALVEAVFAAHPLPPKV